MASANYWRPDGCSPTDRAWAWGSGSCLGAGPCPPLRGIQSKLFALRESQQTPVAMKARGA